MEVASSSEMLATTVQNTCPPSHPSEVDTLSDPLVLLIGRACPACIHYLGTGIVSGCMEGIVCKDPDSYSF